MKTGLYLSLAGALLLAVSGCKTSVNSVENAQKSGQRQMVADQRAITDKSLANKVSIVGVNSAMTPGGFLKVQIELLNNTRSFQRFSYHFEWFDANGMQITTLAQSNQLLCHGAQILSLRKSRLDLFVLQQGNGKT